MNNKFKQLSAVLALGVATTMIAACGDSSDSAAKASARGTETSQGFTVDGEVIASKELWDEAKGGTVAFGSALSETAGAAIVSAFEKDTGIDVEVTRLPSPQLVERVQSEASAGQLSFDAIQITDMTAAGELAEAGALVPYQNIASAQLEKDGVSFANGAFVSPVYLTMAMVYNTNTVTGNAIPKSWKDLDNPEFKDKIGLINVNGAGAHIAFTDLLVKNYGKDFLQDIGDLDPVVYDTVAIQGDALARGEISVAPIALSSALELKKGGAPLGIVVPDPTSSAFMPFGLTSKGADSPAAEVFANWETSKSGQQAAASVGLTPERPDIDVPDVDGIAIPSPADPSFHAFTPEEMTADGQKVTDLWNSIFQS